MPRVQNKRGTASALAAVNPTPLAGELVWDSTENAIKIGDGATAWASLAYVTATPRTHTHSADAITSGTVAYARLPVGSTTSTVCAGDDARLSDARTPTSHTHGNISNAGAIGTTSNLPVITGTSGVLQAGSFGTTANTFCQGNDSRLSDTRTPTDGTVTTAKIVDANVTYAKIQNVSTTDRLLGRSSAGAGVVQEITCTSFGRSLIDDADAAAGRTTLGLGSLATVSPTGTANSTTFLRGDGAWQPVSASGLAENNPVFTGVIRGGDGNAQAPSYSFSSDTNTGIYRNVTIASTEIVLSSNGTSRVRIGDYSQQGVISQSKIGGSDNFAAFLADMSVNVVGGVGYAFQAIGTESSVFNILVSGSTGSWAMGMQTSHALALQTNGTNRLQIGTNGYIGTASRLYVGSTAVANASAMLDINSDTMRLRTARTPASASATGNAGDICWDANYLYIAVATNTWRRIAHSTW